MLFAIETCISKKQTEVKATDGEIRNELRGGMADEKWDGLQEREYSHLLKANPTSAVLFSDNPTPLTLRDTALPHTPT